MTTITFTKPSGETIPLESGLILDGALGWHNTYRVVDFAVMLGMRLPTEDARTLERFRAGEDMGGEDEAIMWIMEDAENWLNSRLDGAFFGWRDGDFVLDTVSDEN